LRLITFIVAMAILCGSAQTAFGQKLYRWVDKAGAVHYTDSVPPEYVDLDRDILNKQGIKVGGEEGARTEEERAEEARLAAAEQAERDAKAAARRRDQILLDTYLSVEEIELLRDRRVELLGARIRVTEQYLTNLRKRMLALERESKSYRPHDPDAVNPMPANLTLDIQRTVGAINLYEGTLSTTRNEQQRWHERFAADITRFKGLKGLN
jgi:hypothetical protein